jgi:hypothetical protein
MVEREEEIIEEWYFTKEIRKEIPLAKYLCEDRVLKYDDASCLQEVYVPSEEDTTDASPMEDTTQSQDNAEKVDL